MISNCHFIRKIIRSFCLAGFATLGLSLLLRLSAAEPGENPEAGSSRFAANQTVEYLPGTLPIIIAAPHGGRLEPAEIPDRKAGVVVTDANSDLLARELAKSLHHMTGKHPHLIICHLKRSKVDCNRDALSGTGGNADAMATWEAFHGCIAEARSAGGAFYFDLHGHSHPEARVELGYQISAGQLRLTGEPLDAVEHRSSIAGLAATSPGTFEERLRGGTSLGGLLEERGFPAIPSPSHADNGEEPYFTGGFNVALYGKTSNGAPGVAIQVECPRPGIRDTAENRQRFASALAESIVEFLKIHAATDLSTGS